MPVKYAASSTMKDNGQRNARHGAESTIHAVWKSQGMPSKFRITYQLHIQSITYHVKL